MQQKHKTEPFYFELLALKSLLTCFPVSLYSWQVIFTDTEYHLDIVVIQLDGNGGIFLTKHLLEIR